MWLGVGSEGLSVFMDADRSHCVKTAEGSVLVGRLDTNLTLKYDPGSPMGVIH